MIWSHLIIDICNTYHNNTCIVIITIMTAYSIYCKTFCVSQKTILTTLIYLLQSSSLISKTLESEISLNLAISTLSSNLNVLYMNTLTSKIS